MISELLQPSQVYEVFARRKYAEPLRHIGYVSAPDDELATVYAKSIYDEWTWVEMIIVPRQSIIRVIEP